MCKRAFDLVATIPAIPMVLPTVALLAVVMAFDTKSFPFFLQVRLGKDLKPFIIYKIKTMNDNRGKNGNLLPDSMRTSKLGEWVRKSRLDELPQLLNVLKGDMSIVGPRPHMIRDVIWWDDIRASVKPGITGFGKINGFKALSDREELMLDHFYVHSIKNMTSFKALVFDLGIILGTPVKIVEHWSEPHSRDLAGPK